MSNDSTDRPSKQLVLFSEQSPAPQFDDKIRRIVIDGTPYFSVLDIFKHYSNATNVTQAWAAAESFLIKQGALGSTENVELKTHKFEGKGQRLTPVATEQMIWRIAQVTTFKEWEELRKWMASLLVERRQELHNPELGIERAQTRFLKSKLEQGMTEDEAKDFLILVQEGHVSRRQWTDVLRQVVRGVIQYGVITDAQYMILFGVKAKEIKEATGFKVARDGMTLLGRQMTNACDIALMDEFKRHNDLTFWQAVELTKQVASDFSPTIKLIQERTGVNLATGQRLMGEGK